MLKRKRNCPGERFFVLFLVAFLFFAPQVHAEKPQIWFYTMEPIWRKLNQWPDSDFADLVDGSRWPSVLHRLGVFQFTEKYAAHAEMGELRQLVLLLNQHGVKVALQGVANLATPHCGLGVEGYGTADETLRSARRLEDAGAKISYIVFDEPLLFGHYFTRGKTTMGCHLSIAEVLASVASREAVLRAAFPGVQIGDSEPFGLQNITTNDWTDAMNKWLDGYEALTGHPWDFIQADVLWSSQNWQAQLSAVVPVLLRHHVALGVFYTGTPAETTDTAWSRRIQQDAALLEGQLKIVPNQVVFSSWSDIPRRILPDTDPTTMTGTISHYIGATR